VLVGCIAACKLLVHLYAGRHYGYFVDELYYLACSRHLGLGYVDHPPLIAFLTWIGRVLLGDSLPAIRFLPAVAGAAEVVFTAVIARELGGGRFAQAFSAIAVLAAPGILAGDGLLSMNAFEPLFWMACAWLLIRIVKTGNQRLWIWFGILAGFGLENKYSMLIFGGGLVLGMLFTPLRRSLASPWLWAGGALALLIFLPNLLWNWQHGFPFLELQANLRRSGRNVPLGPVAFFSQETLSMHPLALPVWLAGLWFYFASKRGRPFVALGCAWLFTAVVIVAMSPRVYYLFPAFPVLFAGGGVMWEQWLAAARWRWARVAWPALLVVTGALLSPIVIPVLPPEMYIRYTRAMHLEQPRIETFELGPLPQLFADQFGWPEMVATVAGVFQNLPPDVRARTAIFAQNYGQAGAIDLYGPQYGLPHAISGHQTYFLWGPGDCTGESVIVMAGRQSSLEGAYESVRKVATVYHPYSMPYEHFAVFYCRGLKRPVKEVWPSVKRWE
jgi:hypothetical protein